MVSKFGLAIMATYPAGSQQTVCGITLCAWLGAYLCLVVRQVPDTQSGLTAPYDYIVVCTKNVPDIPPTVSEVIAPAVTDSHTVIVLIQNGLNIEKPVIQAFPNNVVISGISRMSSAEVSPGRIFHQDHDILIIGAFRNSNLEVEKEVQAAKHFTMLYNASGKASGRYAEDVAFMRWRKLCYNASYNSLCAITGLDTSKLRLAETPVTELLLPAMMEIMNIAQAAGVTLAPDQVNISLAADPIDGYFRPSMQQDIEKASPHSLIIATRTEDPNHRHSGELYGNRDYRWRARKRSAEARRSSTDFNLHLLTVENVTD